MIVYQKTPVNNHLKKYAKGDSSDKSSGTSSCGHDDTGSPKTRKVKETSNEQGDKSIHTLNTKAKTNSLELEIAFSKKNTIVIHLLNVDPMVI